MLNSPALMAVLSRSAAGGSGGEAVTGEDAFGGTEAKWTDDASNFTVGSGVYTAGTTAGQTRYTDAATASVNQWAYVKINDCTTNGIWDGIVLRSEGIGAGTKGYAVAYRAANTSVYVAALLNGAIDDWTGQFGSNPGELAFSNGDYLCVSITGTGAFTVVRVWRKTSLPGDGPSTWGTADLTFNGNAYATANTGTTVGIWNNGTANNFDNFKFGTWTP